MYWINPWPLSIHIYRLILNLKCEWGLPPVGESSGSVVWSDGCCGLSFRSWSTSWFIFSAIQNRKRKWIHCKRVRTCCVFHGAISWKIVSLFHTSTTSISVHWTCHWHANDPSRILNDVLWKEQNENLIPLFPIVKIGEGPLFVAAAVVAIKMNTHSVIHLLFRFFLFQRGWKGRGLILFPRLCWFDVWLQFHLIYDGNQMNLMAVGSLVHAWMPWMPRADKVEYIFVLLYFPVINPTICQFKSVANNKSHPLIAINHRIRLKLLHNSATGNSNHRQLPIESIQFCFVTGGATVKLLINNRSSFGALLWVPVSNLNNSVNIRHSIMRPLHFPNTFLLICRLARKSLAAFKSTRRQTNPLQSSNKKNGE